jgi:hypothetical protein
LENHSDASTFAAILRLTQQKSNPQKMSKVKVAINGFGRIGRLGFPSDL